MSSNYGFITGSLYLIQMISYCLASGYIEMQLLSYTNLPNRDTKGHCCDTKDILSVTDPNNINNIASAGDKLCSLKCAPFFRVCLKQYQTVISDEHDCPYGSRLTNVITNADSNLRESMRFPFQHAWKGDLTIIVEAWHSSSSSSPQGKNDQRGLTTVSPNGLPTQPKQLLIQLADSKSLTVGQEWTKSAFRNDYSQLEIQYRVACDENYYGAQCASFCKPKNDSFGHFTCGSQGEKICMDGWSGKTCNTVCLAGCHPQNGNCIRPNTCECRLGYSGPNCDKCMRYPGCQHGTCKLPYECTCDEGWGGLFCNQDLNYCTHHQPCMNGATCTNTGAGHYTCECRAGYTGTNCETKIETCRLNPCHNGATCKETGTNYTCHCSDGYSGKHCQTFAKTCNEKPCENGATCLNIANGYMCVCADGWEGVNCDMEVDMCQTSPCRNGGSCVTRFGGFVCNCPTGYVGDTCDTNKDDCSPGTCLNGGTCVDKVDNFQCTCLPGFTGAICQLNVDDCIKRPCANGGTCFDMINDYKCECRTGFRGKDCSIDVNECESNPCRYGGTCEDLVGDYVCHCPPCYSGRDCRKRDNNCLNWEVTFKPYMAYYNFTESPGVGVPMLSATSPTPVAVSASLPLIIGLPLVGFFLIVMIALLAVIFYLLRKSKLKQRSTLGGGDGSNSKDEQQRGGGVDDAEANRQNLHNDRLASFGKQYKDNRLSMKLDNIEKKYALDQPSDVGQVAVKNSNLLANNEPKVYKIVAVDKIDYSTVKNQNNIINNSSQFNNRNHTPNQRDPSSYHYHHHRSIDSGLCTPDTLKASALRDDDDDANYESTTTVDASTPDSCNNDSLTCESKSAVLRELSMDSGLASPVLEQLSPHRSANHNHHNHHSHVTRTPAVSSLHQMHRHPPSRHIGNNAGNNNNNLHRNSNGHGNNSDCQV